MLFVLVLFGLVYCSGLHCILGRFIIVGYHGIWFFVLLLDVRIYCLFMDYVELYVIGCFSSCWFVFVFCLLSACVGVFMFALSINGWLLSLILVLPEVCGFVYLVEVGLTMVVCCMVVLGLLLFLFWLLLRLVVLLICNLVNST